MLPCLAGQRDKFLEPQTKKALVGMEEACLEGTLEEFLGLKFPADLV